MNIKRLSKMPAIKQGSSKYWIAVFFILLYMFTVINPKSAFAYDEARVRYIVLDIQIGNAYSYHANSISTDSNVVEAIKRWNEGIRVTNPDIFEKGCLSKLCSALYYKGTKTVVSGNDVRLSSDKPLSVLVSTGKIRGRIINVSGLAVLGTPAKINDIKVATNLNGEFEFSGLSDGIYTVYYEADGYISQTQVLQVSGGGTTVGPTVVMSPNVSVQSVGNNGKKPRKARKVVRRRR